MTHESRLHTISKELGDPGLFPPQVHELFESGQELAAWTALRAASRDEADPQRRRRQEQQLEDLHLWVQPTARTPQGIQFKGIGTALHGRHLQRGRAWITTLWFTWIHVPIWPLSSWQIETDGGDGGLIMGRTPLAPFAVRFRRLAPAGAALLLLVTGALAVALTLAGRRIDVHAINGFDVPLVLSVGDDSRLLAPDEVAVFGGQKPAPVRIQAGTPDAPAGLVDEVADLTYASRQTVIFNPLGRAVLALDWIRYGDGDPPEGHLLTPQTLTLRGRVDYPFVEPPESKEVPRFEVIDNTILVHVDAGITPMETIAWLTELGSPDDIRALASAELALVPDQPGLALMGATLGSRSPSEAEAWMGERLERVPTSVDMHRMYQEVARENDEDRVVARYRATLEAEPESAMNSYLLGRLVDGDEAEALFRRALELDPNHAHGHRGLGYHLLMTGRYPEARDAFVRLLQLDPSVYGEVIDNLLRSERLAGGGHDAQLAHLGSAPAGEAADGRKEAMDLQAGAASLPEDPAGGGGAKLDEYDLAVHARLAMNAGDIDRARRAAGQLFALRGEPGWAAAIAVELASCSDALSGDRRTARERLTGDVLLALDPDTLMLALGIPGPQQEQIRATLAEADFAPLAEALGDGGGPAELEAALAEVQPRFHGPAWHAASRLWTGADARLAEQRAAAWGLPWEVPCR